MRVLVVGSGAREHALVWKFSRSRRISGLFAAPGNAGTRTLATNLEEITGEDPEQVVRAARDNGVNLVFVGPEVPLEAGLVDALSEARIDAIGPPKASAALETSKSFAKTFMNAYNIPTATHRTIESVEEATSYILGASHRVVVKKSGLAAGKGVLESEDRSQLAEFARRVIEDGDRVVVEEHLSGFEVSVFGLSDGASFRLLPPCTDYKKAGAGNSGPNTGGMGALCPVPWLTHPQADRITREIIEPTYDGLRDSDLAYSGVLYFGIMVTEDGPKLLEYNVRLGDPEAQAVVPLVENDLGNVCEAMLLGKLDEFSIRISGDSALGVVVAAPGYPSDYPRDLIVEHLPAPRESEALLFHAATRFDGEHVRTGGGRCFTAVGRGSELLTAMSRAYATAREVVFPGSWFRPDIGASIFGPAS